MVEGSHLVFTPIVRFIGDKPTDATAWIFNIFRVSRNDMNVGVHDCLPGSGSIIESDVESIRLVLLLQVRADFGDETP